MNSFFSLLCALLLLLTGCGTAGTPESPPPTITEEADSMSVWDKVNALMAMRDLDAIFALEDDTDFCTALSSALDDWTAYGEHLDLLSPEAQVFYLCEQLDTEINSDGFVSFIFERYGRYATETVTALETIGAPKTADILRRAISLLPNGVCPTDYFERQDILFSDYDGYSDAYNKLDDEFYAYPDGSLQGLYAAYARAHRECFVQPKE